MKPTPHGTVNGYQTYRCRCADCRNAWRIYYREKVKGICPECGGAISNRYAAKLCLSCYSKSVEAPHGTETRYARCRCDLCREASNAARRQRRYNNPEARLRENRKRLERYYASKKSEEAPT